MDYHTILAITIPLAVGAIMVSKIAMNRPKLATKYNRLIEKEREDYIQELQESVKHYKNKSSNMERGPRFDGDIASMLPDVIGDFGSFAPKWLKPFLANKEIQTVLIDKLQKDPEKFAGLFSKLIKKPNEKDNGNGQSQDYL
jgi:hypothetical protein